MPCWISWLIFIALVAAGLYGHCPLVRYSRDEMVEGGDENWDLRLPVLGSLRAFLRVK